MGVKQIKTKDSMELEANFDKRTRMLRIRKRELKYLGYIFKKGVLQNLSFTGHLEGKKDKKRDRFSMRYDRKTCLQQLVNLTS